jgi:hypothetical protein
MTALKAILALLGFLAILELTALLANAFIWLSGFITPFVVPAILVGFIPAVIYLVHKAAKAHL